MRLPRPPRPRLGTRRLKPRRKTHLRRRTQVRFARRNLCLRKGACWFLKMGKKFSACRLQRRVVQRVRQLQTGAECSELPLSSRRELLRSLRRQQKAACYIVWNRNILRKPGGSGFKEQLRWMCALGGTAPCKT